MRNILRCLLLTGVLTMTLCVGALAVEAVSTTAGVYGLSAGGAVTLLPQTADKTTIAPATQGGYENYYTNAVRFGVTAGGLSPKAQYLLVVVQGEEGTVLTVDNIVYVDQAAADSEGAVTFNAYPRELETARYCVYLVGVDRAYDASSPAAYFDYYEPYAQGDVNGDGSIRADDAQLVLGHVVKTATLSPAQLAAADVTHDSKVLVNDAQKILNYIVENIESLD